MTQSITDTVKALRNSLWMITQRLLSTMFWLSTCSVSSPQALFHLHLLMDTLRTINSQSTWQLSAVLSNRQSLELWSRRLPFHISIKVGKQDHIWETDKPFQINKIGPMLFFMTHSITYPTKAMRNSHRRTALMPLSSMFRKTGTLRQVSTPVRMRQSGWQALVAEKRLSKVVVPLSSW